MTRSTTSSMVLAVACGGAGVAGGAAKAAAAKVLKTKMDKTDRRTGGTTNLHIFFSPSESHVEFNSHARRKIDGLIVLLRRLEFNLLRRANSVLIQAMA